MGPSSPYCRSPCRFILIPHFLQIVMVSPFEIVIRQTFLGRQRVKEDKTSASLTEGFLSDGTNYERDHYSLIDWLIYMIDWLLDIYEFCNKTKKTFWLQQPTNKIDNEVIKNENSRKQNDWLITAAHFADTWLCIFQSRQVFIAVYNAFLYNVYGKQWRTQRAAVGNVQRTSCRENALY